MTTTIELTGTEKQLGWANEIRETVCGYIETGKATRAASAAAEIARLPEILRTRIGTQLQEKLDAANTEKTAKIEGFFGSKTEAGWWINVAPKSFSIYEDMVREIVK